jgi:hypothetical protein
VIRLISHSDGVETLRPGPAAEPLPSSASQFEAHQRAGIRNEGHEYTQQQSRSLE